MTVEQLKTHNLPIGGIYVTMEEMIISTVLGSCVSICLYDKATRVSAMNHYMLPMAPPKIVCNELNIGRYGDLSIPELFDRFQSAGGRLNCAVAKIFGGAHMLKALSFVDIPANNIAIAEAMIEKFRIQVVHKDVGGERGRKIIFETGMGRVLVKEVAKREFE